MRRRISKLLDDRIAEDFLEVETNDRFVSVNSTCNRRHCSIDDNVLTAAPDVHCGSIDQIAGSDTRRPYGVTEQLMPGKLKSLPRLVRMGDQQGECDPGNRHVRGVSRHLPRPAHGVFPISSLPLESSAGSAKAANSE